MKIDFLQSRIERIPDRVVKKFSSGTISGEVLRFEKSKLPDQFFYGSSDHPVYKNEFFIGITDGTFFKGKSLVKIEEERPAAYERFDIVR